MAASTAEVRVILNSIESLPNTFESIEENQEEDNELETIDSSFEIVSDLFTGKILKIILVVFCDFSSLILNLL